MVRVYNILVDAFSVHAGGEFADSMQPIYGSPCRKCGVTLNSDNVSWRHGFMCCDCCREYARERERKVRTEIEEKKHREKHLRTNKEWSWMPMQSE